MRRCVGIGVFAVLGTVAFLAAGPPVSGDPAWPYPTGISEQKHEGREFEIYIPDDVHDPKAGYSLIVTITAEADDLEHLGVHRYIVVAPKPKSGVRTVWSAAEVKELHALTKYLTKQLEIEEHRVHAVGMNEIQGVFGLMVFGKGSPFVSATFVDTAFRGGSVSSHLKKRLNVLAFDFDGTHAGGIKTIEESLRGKVKTVELSSATAGIHGEYFRYWLGVMDGRFEPGHDLSLDWETDADAAQDIPGQVKASKKCALVYFWSPSDKDDADAKALQNETFFDPVIRAYGKRVMPYMLQREEHPKLFEALGLERTPAVAVVDKEGRTKLFEGAIRMKALAKALKRATK